MDILEVLIVGAVASLIIDIIKKQWGTESLTTKIITIGLSLIAGLMIFLFEDTPLWSNFLGVLATASTVYAFILKK
jgi:hypothetical protein